MKFIKYFGRPMLTVLNDTAHDDDGNVLTTNND